LELHFKSVFAHLIAHHPGKEACVVFMTGGAFTDRAKQFLATVPNEVIEKPFSLQDLERIVATRVNALASSSAARAD